MQPAAVLNILVDAQTGKAASELRRFERNVQKTGAISQRAVASVDRMNPAFVRLGDSANRASRSLKRMTPELSFATRVPVYKIAAIGTAIQAAVPPTVALTSALAPLTGLLGALPGLAAAAGQGISTIALASAGVGDAIGAALDAQKTATKDASSLLATNRAAAEQVRTAVRAVGDAERSLADSQRQARFAQEDLSQARRDAARELVDMRLAVQGAVLSEKEARLELSRAIEAQADVWADEQSTAMDAREAELAVQRARLGLRESTSSAKRAQDDYNDAQRKGIRGADQVVAAQRSLADAQRGVGDAQRALIEATRDVRLAQRDQAESASKATAGVEKLQTAMEGLPAAAQDFARFIVDMKPRLDDLRDAAASGIFPGLTRGIRSAMQNFGVVRTAIASTAGALGDLGEAAGRRLGSAEWGRDLAVQGERNVETISRLGNATISLADGFRHITLAAGPLVSFLTRSAERFADVFAEWARGARESGKLDAFFRRTIGTTKLVVEAFWDFGRALINIGKISDRVWGQDLLRGINNVAERFRAWTESVRGQREIEGYFERWRRRWADIARAVGDVIGQYNRLRREGKSVAEAFSTVFADTLAKVIPALSNHLVEAAPRLVSGFVNGFVNASSWGKLLVGTWLVAKLGGRGAFVAIGRMLGLGLGSGVATGAAAAAAGGAGGGAAAAGGLLGAMRGKVLPIAKRVGLAGVGVALADSVLKEFSRRSQERGPDMFEALEAAGKRTELPFGAENAIPFKQILDLGGQGDRMKAANELKDALKGIANDSARITPERAKQLREQIAGIENLAPGVRKAMNSLVGDAEDRFWKTRRAINAVERSVGLLRDGLVFNVKDMREAVSNNFHRIARDIGTDTERGKNLLAQNFAAGLRSIKRFVKESKLSTKEGMAEIARMMETQSGKGAAGVRRNMDDVRNVIARTMRRGGKITAEGLGVIKDLFVKELRLYGLSPREALAGANVRTGEVAGGHRRQDFKQRGGPILRGAPHGDSVPAMLEKGEYVLNRTAVQKVGKQNLDRINFHEAARFQSGGWVGDSPAGLNPAIKSIALFAMRKYGASASDTTRPPGTLTNSGNVSNHSFGAAVDLVGSNMMAIAKGLDARFRPRLDELIYTPLGYGVKHGEKVPPYAEADHYDHVHVAAMGKAVKALSTKLGRVEIQGQGPLRDLIQAGVNRARGAAQGRLDKLFGSMTGGDRGGAPTGALELGPGGPAAQIWDFMLRRNFSAAQAAGWLGVFQKESNFSTTVTNSSSGATGLAQWLGGRLTALKSKKNWQSLQTQLNFVWEELMGPENTAYRAIKGTKTPESAAQVIDSMYERSDAILNATGYAREWFNRFAGRSRRGFQRGGAVGYVGDSLGQGTAPKLRGILNRPIHGNSVKGRSSASGVSALEGMLKHNGQFVFDLGTNDGDAGSVASSLRAFDSKTGKKPLHALTLLGPDAEAKNAKLRSLAGGDVSLVDWAKVAGRYVGSDPQGIHPNAAGYARRAQMLAASIRRRTGDEQKAGKGNQKGSGNLRPFGGPAGKVLNKTLKTLRTGDAKARGVRLKQFANRIKKMGVPDRVKRQLDLYATGATIYGKNADFASRLNVDNEDGTTTLGVFQGKNEAGWLTKQLETLASWRNKLVDAVNIVQKRRKEMAALAKRAKKRLEQVVKDFKKAAKVRDRLGKQLKELKKKPKVNKKKIDALTKTIKGVDENQKGRARVRDGLRNKIIPVLEGRQRSLKTSYDSFVGEEGLTGLQGPNGPMGRLATLPPLGTLRGTIGDVQLRLRDLGLAGRARSSDTAVADDETREMLRELLRQANLRFQVSQRQYDVFKNFDRTSGAPFMGAFAQGGVALVGERGPELAHLPSGTRVHSADDTRRLTQPNVKVVVYEGEGRAEVFIDDRKVEQVVERVTRRQSRHAGRGLPGRGGGGF